MTSPNDFNEKETFDIAEHNQSETAEEGSIKKKIEYDEILFENSTVFGTSTVTVKKRKLKPLTKGLIISCVSIVIAAAILAITFIIPSMTDDSSTSSLTSTPTYTVVDIDVDAIERVTVLNANHPDGYSMYKEYATDSSDSESSATSSGTPKYTWRVEGYEKYDLSSAKYLVEAAVRMTSNKKYESLGSPNADDYEIGDFTFADSNAKDGDSASSYGFDSPYSAVIIEHDGNVFKIIVGNSAPDGSGRYVTVSGDDSIYVVNETKLPYFNSDCKDMIGLLAVTYMLKNDSNSDYYQDGALARIDSIKLGGTCRSSNITIESPPDELSAISFVTTSPVFRACDEDAVNYILSIATSGLTNSGSYVLGYTDADLEKFGLNTPYSTIEINIADFHVSLKFGEAIDGYYPCIVNGSDIIYRIPVGEGTEDNPDWISFKDTDIYYESLYLEYITGISSINMSFADKQATFNLNHTVNDNGTKTFSVDCAEADDGVTISRQQMSFYYSRILNLSAESITEDAIPEVDPYLTITVKYTDESRTPDVIRLYKYSTRRYFYTLNGQGNALVSAKTVEDLYDRMNDLLSGVEIRRLN